eukprot:7517075-Pyramimonas_sp.AAC.1
MVGGSNFGPLRRGARMVVPLIWGSQPACFCPPSREPHLWLRWESVHAHSHSGVPLHTFHARQRAPQTAPVGKFACAPPGPLRNIFT